MLKSNISSSDIIIITTTTTTNNNNNGYSVLSLIFATIAL